MEATFSGSEEQPNSQ